MRRSLAELNYEGAFSYLHGDELSSLRVVHVVEDGIQREQLIHLNGARREIIRKGDEIFCVLRPGDQLLKLNEAIPSGPFARAFTRTLTPLPEYYRARIGATSRVADRESIEIIVDPVDDARYGYRLWLDKRTGLLLRSALLGNQDRPLELFQFVTIAIDERVAAPEFDIEAGRIATNDDATIAGDDVIYRHLSLETTSSPELREQKSDAGAQSWKPGWLPPGFRMSGADLREPASGKATDALMYTDGLASFSIFIDSGGSDPGGSGHAMRKGATVAVMREREGRDGDPVMITVVGEVPMKTAERVAAQMRLADSSS